MSDPSNVSLGRVQGPADANPGDKIEVGTYVTNNNDSPVDVSLTASNDNGGSDSTKQLSLAAGEQKRVLFDGGIEVQAGDNTFTISVDGGPSISATLPVSEPDSGGGGGGSDSGDGGGGGSDGGSGGDADPSNVSLGSIQGPATASPGDSITVGGYITNNNDSSLSLTAYVENGSTGSTAETDVTLSAGQQRDVDPGSIQVQQGINDITFGVRNGPSNTVEFPVEGEGDQPSTSFSIVGGQNPAEIGLNEGRNVSAFNREAFPVEVEVRNDGDNAGSVSVELSPQGEDIEQQTAKTIDPGSVRTFDMYAPVPSPGESLVYDVTLLDTTGNVADSDSFVTERESEPQPDASIVSINAPSQLPETGPPLTEAETFRKTVFPFTVEVLNEGSEGSLRADVFTPAGGGGSDTQTVPADSAKTFELLAAAPGKNGEAEYDVTVFLGNQGEDSQTFTVSRAGDPAEIAIGSVSLPESPLPRGSDNFDVSVSLSNIGDDAASGEVLLDGEGKEISLAPGQTQSLSFTLSPPEPGSEREYTIETPTGQTETFSLLTEGAPASFDVVDIRAPDLIDPEEYPVAFDL